MNYFVSKKYFQIYAELGLFFILVGLYFTNLDNPFFQNSPVIGICRFIGILGLLSLIGLRLKNLFRSRSFFTLLNGFSIAYTFALLLFFISCLFDPLFMKVKIYFSLHRSEFEQLVKVANDRSCTPSDRGYCEGRMSLPFELLNWSDQNEMFVIKELGKLYITLAYKYPYGVMYISDQNEIPSYLGVSHYDVNCYAKVSDYWFMCTMTI
jgi:hypothetical protein